MTLPPHDLEAEEAVLGAMLLSARAAEDALGVLRAGDFYRASHGDIFHACQRLHDRREPVDAVTVTAELRSGGVLDRAGGLEVVLGLSQAVTHASSVRAHAQIVRDRARRRRVLEAGLLAVDLATSADTADEAESAAMSLLQGGAAPGGIEIITMRDAIAAWHADAVRDAADGGVRMPWPTLALHLGPLRRTEVVTVAARAGCRKTWFLLECMRAFLRRRADIGALALSLEMPPGDIAERTAGLALDDDTRELRKATASSPLEDVTSAVMSAEPALERAVFTRRPITVRQLVPAIRAARAQSSLDIAVVLIDYLGLLADANPRQSRYERVSDAATALKRVAVEEEVLIICATQLSRAAGDGSIQPALDMMRDSGAVEEASDRIVGLWRPYMHKEAVSAATRRVVGCTILKNRQGEDGHSCELAPSNPGQRLVEVSEDYA